MRVLLYRGEDFDPNSYYHSGVDIDHSFFLSGPRSTLFVPKLNEQLARSRFKGKVVVYQDPLKELSKYIKGKSIGADFYSLNAHLVEKLRKICHLKNKSKELLHLRAKKSKDEVNNIRRAVKLTKEIFASLDLKAAKTELDLEKQIRILTAEMGREQAFDPVVASGKNTSFPHYKASKKKLESVVLVDYGVRYKHYCADLTRCFILDGNRKKEYEELQNIVHKIADELPEMKTGKQLADFSSKLMKKAGFPKPIHAIGHGIGLDVHEGPSLGSKSKDKLAGSVLAIEPAFYLPNKYGLRFEEDIYFDGKTARVL